MDQFVRSLMEDYGAAGIALLMFLENIFPPIPSEIIMPLAGYQAADGRMSLQTVVLAGTAGSLLGILPWYVLGLLFGKGRLVALAARHGRWMTMGPRDVEKADRWFRDHGYNAVFFGRLVPTVRTLISVPAGLSRMPFGLFLFFSALGTAVWTSGLALAGYLLGRNYQSVDAWVGPVSNAVIAGILVLYVYRVWTFTSHPKDDDRR